MEVTQLINYIIAGAAAASAMGTLVSALLLYRTIRLSARGQQAQIFLEISQKYDAIYSKRNQLLRDGIDWDELNRRYTTYEELVNSKEWREFRDVAGCFEFIGVLVKNKYINENVLFDMIVVNPPLNPADGQLTVWERVENFIGKARVRNPHLWENWQYLVEKEKEYYRHKKRGANLASKHLLNKLWVHALKNGKIVRRIFLK